MTKQSNRNIPVEQWPESLDILRHLATLSAPIPIKDVAHNVCAPEISTRNRLAKLEAQGTVRAMRAYATLSPGKQVNCTHYVITQYGKDCAGGRTQSQGQAFNVCANSVFSWAAAVGAGQSFKKLTAVCADFIARWRAALHQSSALNSVAPRRRLRARHRQSLQGRSIWPYHRPLSFAQLASSNG